MTYLLEIQVLYACEDHENQKMVSYEREKCGLCDKWMKRKKRCDVCHRFIFASDYKDHRKDHFKDMVQ